MELRIADCGLRIKKYKVRIVVTAIVMAILIPLASLAEQQKTPTTPKAKPQVSTAEFEKLKEQADAAREANQISDAIDLYNRLLKLRPSYAEGWWYLGTLYYDSDQYAPGAQAFGKYVILETKNGAGWAMLGLCEYQTGDYASALQHLTKARTLGLGRNEELARAVRYHQALLLIRGRQFQLGMTILFSFAAEQRESAPILDAMGLAALQIPEPLDRLNPSQREMVRRFGKATFLEAQQKNEEAFEMYSELEAAYKGQPNVAYAFGCALLMMKEREQALEQFKRELNRDPRHMDALLQMTFALISLSRFDDALPYAQKASEVDPLNYAPYYLLGRISLYQDQLPRAITLLEKAASLAPESATVYYSLSQAYQRAGRPEDAAKARKMYDKLDALEKQRRGELVTTRPVDSSPDKTVPPD